MEKCNSTFGNLDSTTDWLEALFVIIVITIGLLLVTMLIGNIKVRYQFGRLSRVEINYQILPNFSFYLKCQNVSIYTGVSACNNIEETSDAVENEKHGVVDE